MTLPLQDKEWFARQLEEDIRQQQAASPYTWDEARERLAVAKEQFRTGQYRSHAEVMQPRKRVAV